MPTPKLEVIDARSVADKYTREYLYAWLSEEYSGNETKLAEEFASVNADRAIANLEPLTPNTLYADSALLQKWASLWLALGQTI